MRPWDDDEYGHHPPCPCGATLADECPMSATCARVHWADRKAPNDDE